MKIDILCSDANHPVNAYLERWIAQHAPENEIRLLRDTSQLENGTILFLVSCSQIVSEAYRQLYDHVMVLHASDLPKGRGWSPHIWAIIEGGDQIVVTLLAAADSVDSGAIWAQEHIKIQPGALFCEINAALFKAEIELMSKGIEMVRAEQTPVPQRDETATFYPKRTPEDSRLDPQKTIAELFNLMRVADPERYPAFFEIHGEKYTLELKKVRHEK